MSAVDMTLDHDRLDTMNDRANFLFGNVWLGNADEGDLIEANRSATAFQNAACGDTDPDTVTIDYAALEAWYESQTDVPY